MATKRKPTNGQQIMTFGWGGWRPDAGRKSSRRRNKRVLHRERPRVSRRTPTHVTLKVRPELVSLRTKKRVQVIRRAAVAARVREGFRIIDWSIQTNHIHAVIEADDAEHLARGMQGFCVRIARGLNALAERTGAVFTERYHLRLLHTPAEVRNARAYVLLNRRRHVAQRGTRIARGWVDPFSSWAWFDGWRDLPGEAARRAKHERAGPPPVAAPQSWLVRVGWRQRGLISVNETPAACKA
jgi:REP element-mobilizing transposase RayT